ncbi:PREDICTED: DDT domain-containing protein DDB_G0282237 isoform X1 [Tarenaya hassleriana]|uniref:DDT domain-containing protein DDB_G0282237 isoform X1 n=1 Tax=Tarenaya hassleriana TaxID=28532 RepID=UPI00053CA610|nr:PREDICTED: DDT domain-containing protein DDB_G0282237 isoform X1 [Tarenaya hassleriana]
MPLLKKKPHKLLEPPKDLESNELVYQVRLTKEIFRDYQLYLKKINLYQKRVWTCKSTGKTSLTYEEALESERHASEKVQALPKELVAPALRIIQFSTFSLKDLAEVIVSELQSCFFVGAELYGKRNGELFPCRILKIVEDRAGKSRYEVRFLDKDKKIDENTVLSGEDLSWKKFPFSRNFLKSFIRESTCRSIPWVVNDNLALLHGISKKIPKELQSKYVFQGGQLIHKRNRQRTKGDKTERENGKRKRAENGRHVADGTDEEVNESEEESINYPIEDLMVQPGPDDPDINERPSPSRDFSVPMDCVGDLLMVWDFCSSFARQLNLYRFSLEDFENAVCHKESNLVLIMEAHACLFQFLINDGGDNFSALQKRNRKSKITLITWTEYLCDFLESINIPDFSSHIGTIKRGHYGLLYPDVKLKMFRELVNQITETSTFKRGVDELIEQRHAVGAARREEALEEGRKKREEKKERSKTSEEANGVLDRDGVEDKKNTSHVLGSCSRKGKKNGFDAEKNNEFISSEKDEPSEKRLLENVYQRKHKKQMLDTKTQPKEEKELTGKEQPQEFTSEDKNGNTERRSAEQRVKGNIMKERWRK